MTLFDRLTDTVIKTNRDYVPLLPVVEKELLHRDILREMSRAGFLKDLTFIGGTCLRVCYGSPRLSEDLDFTGGFHFKKRDLAGLGSMLGEALHTKYGLKVRVEEPVKETGNVDTWKIRVVTRPERKNLPEQRIHIDICTLPSHERLPTMVKDPYGVDINASGIILYAESRSEILADKIIAIANRPNRVKNRDLWDVAWLTQRNVTFPHPLLRQKLADRKLSESTFRKAYAKRLKEIATLQNDFLFEMRRFLAPSAFDETFTSSLWWNSLCATLKNEI
jgi:predicted nucleotidyltransferase component of viral defense system